MQWSVSTDGYDAARERDDRVNDRVFYMGDRLAIGSQGMVDSALVDIDFNLNAWRS